MPQPAPLLDPTAFSEPAAAPAAALPASAISSFGDDYAWADSPARLLHERLVATFIAPPRDIDTRLPLPARAAIIAGAGLACWVAIGMAALALL